MLGWGVSPLCAEWGPLNRGIKLCSRLHQISLLWSNLRHWSNTLKFSGKSLPTHFIIIRNSKSLYHRLVRCLSRGIEGTSSKITFFPILLLCWFSRKVSVTIFLTTSLSRHAKIMREQFFHFLFTSLSFRLDMVQT